MANEVQLLKVAPKLEIVAKQLNQSISETFGNAGKEGFEKAYFIANAIEMLQVLLVPEYMKPIMALQGNKLGFKTDKDKTGGYDEKTVKNCLIEAVLTGVQPVGNHFNIISSNCYLTKEGFGYLLKNLPNLWYEITPGLPRVNNDKTGAAIPMHIEWKFKNTDTAINEKKIDIAVKVDQYTSVDGIIGKATRKARAWLYNTITGSEIADGDITDMQEIRRKEGADIRASNLSKETEDAIKKAAEGTKK